MSPKKVPTAKPKRISVLLSDALYTRARKMCGGSLSSWVAELVARETGAPKQHRAPQWGGSRVPKSDS